MGVSETGKKQICETCPTYLQNVLFGCRKSLEPLSQIATVVLFFAKYLPMTSYHYRHNEHVAFCKLAFYGS